VEQDLIIERALVELFSNDFLRENLAFRGGTAIYKLYFKPQVRYSEDIDLVQIKSGPIKPVLQEIRKALSFLGTKRDVEKTIHNVTVRYKFNTEIEPIVSSKLKIEINSREHFTVLGWKKINQSMSSSWFTGSCNIVSFELEELLGTKLRALYQRKKGRDLFDLFYAISNADVDTGSVIHCFREVMKSGGGKAITAKEFIINMDEKIKNPYFRGDIVGLIRPGVSFDMDESYELVRKALLEKI
jgi:predicted nucleotidyltransferase component of viral defense system